MTYLFRIAVCFSLMVAGGFANGGDLIGDLIEKSNSKPTQQKAPTKPAASNQVTKPNITTPEVQRPWVIVIDPGHGGKDTGAIGYKGIREKDVVLAISKAIAKKLKAAVNAHIFLTRENDTFLSLGKRDDIAIAKKADMFLSIHANAAARKEANGIEIYYLNDTDDEASNRLAARENKGSQTSLSDMKKILSTLIQTDSTVFSRRLAIYVKEALERGLAKKYKLERLKIKQALFYVLVGSQAPSILLETGFITNPQEAKRLKQKKYQEGLADAVTSAVVKYFSDRETRKDY